MKTALLALASIVLMGCQQTKPISRVAAADSPTFEAELLGTIDGCKVYTFSHKSIGYFAKCGDRSVTIKHTLVPPAVVEPAQ